MIVRCLLAFVLISNTLSAAPAFVQANGLSVSPVPLSLAYSSNNTSGNLLIVCAEMFSSDPPYSISDTQGNTWNPVFTSSGVSSSHGWDLVCWYAMNSKGGANTVTADSNTHSSSNSRLTISEYSGIATTNALDGSGNHTDSSGAGTALSSGSFTVTAGDLVIGYGFGIGGSIAAGSGYTGENIVNGVTILEDQIAGGVSANATATAASGNWTMTGFAFKVPAAGGPPANQFPRIL